MELWAVGETQLTAAEKDAARFYQTIPFSGGIQEVPYVGTGSEGLCTPNGASHD